MNGTALVPMADGWTLSPVFKVNINTGEVTDLDARLVYYPDENHWILSPQNSIHWFGEFHNWLKR